MGHLLCGWSGLRHAIGLMQTLYFIFSICMLNKYFNTIQHYAVVELHVSVCGFVFICSCTYGGQKRVSNPLELELQAAVACVTWVLRTEHESS